jgi:glycosyltransferase involved in cell wall biosynthesis
MFSIVIPAYNEENAIDDTINRCKNIIKEYGDSKSEIIVVDDASSDSTFEKVKKTGVVALKHPHNIGYGRSLKDGILKSENDIIIITDADGTYPIESIPDLLEEYKKGYDMVVGARQGKHYHESFFKRRFRGILRFLVEFTAGRKIPDINSGLRVFGKKEIVNFFDTLCDTFSFTTSLTLAYMMKGKYVKYIPIEYEKRIGKTKVKLFKDSTRTLQFIVEAILYYNPIKIFLVFDYLLIILAVINLVIAFFTKLQIAYLIGVGSILLAILIFSLGLLSIQLKQLISRAK